MRAPFDLDGKTALVTGASGGLGERFATTLAGAGARVALAARREDRLHALATRIEADGGRAVPVVMDVTRRASVVAAFDNAERALGPVTVLVNNSGVAVTRAVLEVEPADWERVMGTNLDGAWHVAQEGARRMAAAGTGGSIVNIASVTAFRVAGGLSTYATSKAALVHLTRAMALELARHRIRVNAIAPGYILTDMNREFFASDAGQALIRRIPQRRLGTPQDLDGPLLLLASDASSFMTGACLEVDGGHLHSSL